MSTDQIRWKMNSLQKKYKECSDNNSKSGRGTIEFKWYNQMDEIFGKNKDAIAAHTVSSGIIVKEVSKSKCNQNDIENCRKSKSLTENIYVPTSPVPTSPVACTSKISLMNKNKELTSHTRHGTGTNLANKKLNIEKQWLTFLENKEIRDAACDKRHEQSEERAIENFALKKQIISLKRKQLEQKKEIANKKLKDKENRHAEIMEIEKTKCNLLKKLLHQVNVKNNSDESDE